MNSSLNALATNLVALAEPRQAEIVMTYNILSGRRLRDKQPLDAGRNLEQPAVMAVARNQHQSNRQSGARDRNRNRARVEEIPRRGIAQHQCVLDAERV